MCGVQDKHNLFQLAYRRKKSLPSCLPSEFCTILDMAKKFYFQGIFFNAVTQRRQRSVACASHIVVFIAHCQCPTSIAKCQHSIASHRIASHSVADAASPMQPNQRSVVDAASPMQRCEHG